MACQVLARVHWSPRLRETRRVSNPACPIAILGEADRRLSGISPWKRTRTPLEALRSWPVGETAQRSCFPFRRLLRPRASIASRILMRIRGYSAILRSLGRRMGRTSFRIWCGASRYPATRRPMIRLAETRHRRTIRNSAFASFTPTVLPQWGMRTMAPGRIWARMPVMPTRRPISARPSIASRNTRLIDGHPKAVCKSLPARVSGR